MNRFANYVIAYHGCDRLVRDSVINGGTLKKSTNTYDWLGNGIYFWENDERRALEWAEFQKKVGKVKEPAVVGAVIDLGNCLDLTQRDSVDFLKAGYQLLLLRSKSSNFKIPDNHTVNKSGDILKRDLDCAVIEQIHYMNRVKGYDSFDTVRGLFPEGDEVYPGSCFVDKTHVQICVVNTDNIIGYFLPRNSNRKKA